jgi:hypothetical protein
MPSLVPPCTQGTNTHVFPDLYQWPCTHTHLHIQTYCLLCSTEATMSLQFGSSVPVECYSFHLYHFYCQLTIR